MVEQHKNHRSIYILPAYAPFHVFFFFLLTTGGRQGVATSQDPSSHGVPPGYNKTPLEARQGKSKQSKAKGAREAFWKLIAGPIKKRVQSSLGTARVPSLAEVHATLLQSGVPALFRKEFMVSWRAAALGHDEQTPADTSLSRPHWLPDSLPVVLPACLPLLWPYAAGNAMCVRSKGGSSRRTIVDDDTCLPLEIIFPCRQPTLVGACITALPHAATREAYCVR